MFGLNGRLRQKKQVRDAHRKQQGEQIGTFILRHQQRLADYLYNWQFRVGFRMRNVVLLTIWTLLVSYFVFSFFISIPML